MVSRTSIYTAACRAVGAREPDPAARNPDHLADALLGDPAQLALDHPITRALGVPYAQAMQDGEVVSTVRMMMVRTRFVDEALARAVAGGATQVAILGAGFDSHAYRCQTVLAGARVFEVDRPDTQALKRERVRTVIGDPPANLTYVPVDFQRERLPDVLTRHGYDLRRTTFFVLEGVTMYLPEPAVRDTLGFIAAHPPGSSVVFDFVYRPMVDMLANVTLSAIPESFRPYVERFLDLIKDEPWLFGMPVGGEREFLSGLGLDLREAFVIGGDDSLKKYAMRNDGRLVGAETMAAGMARAMERARNAAPGSPEAVMRSPERMREQQRLMAYQMADAVVAAQAWPAHPRPFRTED